MNKITPKQQFLLDLAKEQTVREDVKKFSTTGAIMNVNGSNFKQVNKLFMCLDDTYADNLNVSYNKY